MLKMHLVNIIFYFPLSIVLFIHLIFFPKQMDMYCKATDSLVMKLRKENNVQKIK